MKNNPLTAIDFYKADHARQYPTGTTEVYSNFTPRSNRLGGRAGEDGYVINFGMQFFIKEFLIETWSDNFFALDEYDVVDEYKRRMDNALGKGAVDVERIRALHQLGYLPIKVKSLPEGARVPFGVPVFTIKNTHPDFFWLTNYLESVASSYMWKPITTATTAFKYKQILLDYAKLTGAPKEFVDFQLHDFSFRGMTYLTEAAMSAAAHLTCFKGTDTVAGIDLLENYYGALSDSETVGVSVPATEHSVMCMGEQNNEIGTFKRLINDIYPSGIVSIVSDTWDFWKVLTEYAPELKEDIMSRDGKCVFRPDCYDDKTQILTDSGWKMFVDLRDGDKVAEVLDDGSYIFSQPNNYIEEHYDGEMHHFHDGHGKIDQMVTPEHRMITYKNGAEKITYAKLLKCNHDITMRRSAKQQGDDNMLTDQQRLCIAFQADGSYTTSGNKIRFSFSKQRKIDRLDGILERCNITSKKYMLSDGRVEYNIDVNGDEYHKDFGWVDVANINSSYAKSFIEELSYWDATRRHDNRFKFDTTNSAVMDAVERIALAAGYGCLISHKVDDRKPQFNDVFTAHIITTAEVGVQCVKHDIVKYTGKIYCVTVDSGKILVKRNRSTLVCGNSGDPVKIICGDPDSDFKPAYDGAVRVLEDTFGSTTNMGGFATLDNHVGLIYGDSITLERAETILSKLLLSGYASNNIVFGVGSYSYQYVTRDTFGFAMKATSGVVNGERRNIFKNPKTDNGTKKSAKGLLRVELVGGDYVLHDQQTVEEEDGGELRVVFEDGLLMGETTLSEIRNLIDDKLDSFRMK